jgi:hypothetical protein
LIISIKIWYNKREVIAMADYADVSEIDEIEKLYAHYPSVSDIGRMCYALGIKMDTIRTLDEADAWAYYHELEALIEAQKRKTA